MKICDYVRNLRQVFFDSYMHDNKQEEWLILLYLSHIKKEKILKKVMKDIKNIKSGNQIMETVKALEKKRDNTRKILSQEAKAL